MNNFITKAAALFVATFIAFCAAFPCAAQEELYESDGPDYFCLLGMFGVYQTMLVPAMMPWGL